MEDSRRMLPAIVLLFLLLISSGALLFCFLLPIHIAVRCHQDPTRTVKHIAYVGMTSVEARKCESASHKFKGLCFRASNCANVCKTEGFHGGHCRGLRRRCFCTKHCNSAT
ncbi:hypothetical protein C4D60_Mb08t13250 [Musa balbisiana]|uniref:Knottins-like domain-containing protein n=1 Tax=Musa balbisiana TaxID=52838 RepID=A0A4V4H8X1_MUSBA|nr:hypothetical protein C4D60_Mb08t13250 [Musa balbisiana]